LIIHKFENIWPSGDRFGAEEFAFGAGAPPARITASVDPLKSRHLPDDWLSTSPNGFNGLTWASGIGRVGEPTVFDGREGGRLAMNYSADGSKSQQSDRLKHFLALKG
jgi:hypothetical protein